MNYAMHTQVSFDLVGRKAHIRRDTSAEVAGLKALNEILSYSKPGAHFSPLYNRRDEDGNRIWDGKEHMVKYNAISVGLLRGAQKEIKAAGIELKVFSWKNRPKVELKHGFISYGEQYEYQNKCVSAMLNAIRFGGATILSGTGTGKTAMAAQFFSWINGKCMFIVDQVNLLYQSQKEISKWLKEPIGVVGNSKFEPGRVTVATIQTLQARKNDRQFHKWMRDVDVVVIDELHKQLSKRNFQIVNTIQAQAVFGLTATLEMKKKAIRWKVCSIAGRVAFEFPIDEGVQSGVLSTSVVIQVAI